MAALDAPRTGRMQDVVATIQAEQDVVIRRPRAGVTVVQGAPGTGKTAVALHRAAYLLYAERTRLAGAVLFVGPSSTFLRYVEDVVPSLGEDRVVLATPADLGPPSRCRRSTRRRRPRSRAISAWSTSSPGRSAPTSGRRGRASSCGRGGSVSWSTTTTSPPSWRRRRRRSTTHNAGRPLVERLLLRALEAAYRNGLERDHRIGRIGPEAVRYAPALLDVVDRDALAQALHAMWPVLTPEVLVRRLLASPRRLANAGATSSRPTSWTRCMPSNEGGDGWSEADVALLDEADVLLGPVPARPQRAGGRRPSLDHVAERILEERLPGLPAVRAPTRVPARARRRAATGWTAGSARPRTPRPRSWVIPPPTSCTACTRSSPTSSTSRRRCRRCARPTRGTATSSWTRPRISRRCSGGRSPGGARHSRSPSPATRRRQSAPARRRRGTASSRRSASRRVRCRRHELTVNYRTPAEVMELAGRLLEQFAPHLHPARSVRTAGVGPRRVHTGGRPLGAADIADAVADIRSEVGGRAGRGGHVPSTCVADRDRRRRASHRRRREGVGVRRCRRRRSRGHRPRSRRARRAWRASMSRSPGRRRG